MGDALNPSANSSSFKYVIGDEPIGHIEFIRLDREKRRSAIGFVYIRNDLRGRGYGKEMICLFLDYARNKLNLTYLDMYVGEDNEAARVFYEKCGFGYSGETLMRGGVKMLVMFNRSTLFVCVLFIQFVLLLNITHHFGLCLFVFNKSHAWSNRRLLSRRE